MKTFKNIIIISSFFMLSILPLSIQADPPGMPGSHGESGDQPPGGGAPIGGGIGMVIAMSLAYLGKRTYQLNQE